MKRILDNLESLEAVRLKCTKRQTDFTKEELRHLNLVNIELQKSYGKKYVKPLDQSCGRCKITAMNSVHNYIMFEESKDATKNKDKNTNEVQEENKPSVIVELGKTAEELVDIIIEEHKIERPTITDIEITSEDDKLSLKELRIKHPHIKARSVERFLELLKEE